MATRPSTNPTKVAAALADLQQRIQVGQEFPDAAHATARRHNVDQSALEAAYDEADRQREQRAEDAYVAWENQVIEHLADTLGVDLDEATRRAAEQSNVVDACWQQKESASHAAEQIAEAEQARAE